MPLTVGYSLPWACIYFARVPAFKNGLSFLPPPATVPTIALHFWLRVRNLPDGNLTVTPCVLWPYTTADEPAAFINLPPSPAFFSILHTAVPSGIDSNARIFPALAVVLVPTSIELPTIVPAGAGINECFPLSNCIFARGASRPLS